MRNATRVVKGGKFLLVVGIVLFSIALYRMLDAGQLRAMLAEYPLGYLVAFAVLPVFFFPVPILALAGGAVFGTWWGTVYTILGALINSAGMFYLSRFLGSEIRSWLQSRKGSGLRRLLLMGEKQENLFVFFFLLRLVPLVSYSLINYGAGLTAISLRAYLLSTFLGILPGTVLMLAVGEQMLHPGSVGFWVSIGLLLALLLLSLVLLKWFQKKYGYCDCSDL